MKPLKEEIRLISQPGIDVEVLNPGTTYYSGDLNQNSVVLKVTDEKVSFLLMGDAGLEAENDIMKAGYNINADILKVGHHASRTSSGETFISAVSPSISVIEVGAGNDYGHPHMMRFLKDCRKLQRSTELTWTAQLQSQQMALLIL